MEFDEVADGLYAGEPAEFVASRTAAAREAKQAGDAELAARIRALRKPTTAAFHVNRLARDGSAALTELAELGERLRAAHANLAGAELRELSERRASLVQSVVRDSPGLSDAVAREVEETLETMVADPGVARLVLAGRLTSVAHRDADQWLSLPSPPRAPSASARAKKPAAKPKAAPQPRKPDAAAARKSEKDRRDREERQRKLTAATRARAEASRALVRAERIAEQADARLTELRERLADAEERARAAAGELASTRSAFEAADQAVQQLG